MKICLYPANKCTSQFYGYTSCENTFAFYKEMYISLIRYLTFKDIQYVEYIYIQQTNDYLTSMGYITREICSTFYIFASYKCI